MLDNKLIIINKNELSSNEFWQTVTKYSPNLSDWGVARLSETLDKEIKTLVIEKKFICKDFRNLYSNYYSKKFKESSFYCDRLHFFSCDIKKEFELKINPENYRNNYLGFSVIRPVPGRCIGRTVIDPYKIGKSFSNGYYCLRTEFRVNICGANYLVSGFPYASQDTEVTVCAQTALWGVCRYFSERYSSYKEIYPFDLVLLTGNSNGRTFPYRGMSYSDYSKILSEFGVFPQIIKFDKNKKNIALEDKFKDVCAYVESGFPILASLGGHVVTLIGHTLNYERKIQYDSDGFGHSSDLIDNFIVIDDNKQPYSLLPMKKCNLLSMKKNDSNLFIDSIQTAVCPLPEKVFLTAKKARLIACESLLKLKKDLTIKEDGEKWITRLYLTTCSAFKTFKLKAAVENKDKLSYFVSNLDLPHFVWVMEVSTIDNYKNNTCVAEIILDATSGIKDKGQLYLRFGKQFWVNDIGKKIDTAPKTFDLFTHNLGGP